MYCMSNRIEKERNQEIKVFDFSMGIFAIFTRNILIIYWKNVYKYEETKDTINSRLNRKNVNNKI